MLTYGLLFESMLLVFDAEHHIIGIQPFSESTFFPSTS